MRLTIFIIAISLIQVSAKTNAQISLNKKNVALKEVLKSISVQSGYDFLYNDQTLKDTKRVSIHVDNVSLRTALKQCFDGQPLTYAIEDKTVVIKEKENPGFLEKILDRFNNIDVRGYVFDEADLAIPGATVRVKGTNQVAITNESGAFYLKNVDDRAVIVVTVVGYNKEELPAVSNVVNNVSNLLVQLTLASAKLDEVQVIAYGTTSERLSTGNVSSVSAKQIGEQPVSNVLLALEGSVPGLFVTQSSGMPGAGVTVQIQGQNSLSFGNDPFYVVDGVPYVSQLLPSGVDASFQGGSGKGFGSQAGNPLNYLNPGDIESVSVLKGADATAIYGSRAANGAILITTKKGKPGVMRVGVNLQNGWGQDPHMLDLMNTQQYLQMRHEALKNDGITPSLANGDYDLLQWDTTRYTNWQKKLLGGTAHYQDYSASVSGGTVNTQYLISSTFHRETTVFPTTLADGKGSVHFNVSSASANQKFKVQLSGNYMIDNNELPFSSQDANFLPDLAINLAPDAPNLYNKDGSLNWAPNASGASTWTNPLSQFLGSFSNKTNNLISNAVMSYDILPGLRISSSFGYTNLQSKEIIEVPLSEYPPEYRPYYQNEGVFTDNSINSWIVEPQINYKRLIGKGNLEALVGSTIEQRTSNGQTLYGYGYTSVQTIGNIGSAQQIFPGTSTISTYKYNALFGRLSYNWNDKYLINFTGRRDGSSRFGSANEFHDFGSIGTGWIFSNEDFIKKGLPFLSFGKIRSSYGTTGNDQIGDYTFLNQYSVPYINVPYQGSGSLAPTGLPNPYLQWEVTKKLEFGLDLGFFKDRISLKSTYYRNRSSNLLTLSPLSYVTGFPNLLENSPATVQNTGWEFALTTTNVKSSDFTWKSSFNLTLPQNKLIAYPNLATSGYANSYVIGQPITIVKLYHALGPNPTTGLYQFAGANGPTSNPGVNDKTVIENTAPKFYGGFANTFSYKSLRLDVLLQFTKRVATNLLGNSRDYGAAGYNAPVAELASWQKPGDKAPYQAFNSNYSSIFQDIYEASSDAAYSDASYIRLKNLALSWQLPKTWYTKIGLQNARLYIQGQNLFTLTRYKGQDPETAAFYALPTLRVVTAGIEVGL